MRKLPPLRMGAKRRRSGVFQPMSNLIARRLEGDAVREASDLWPSILAALFGVFILYGVGFASPLTIHEAAHDSRHAFTFPCH